jgi:uncharacterized membrane protein (DUF2068 family)
VGLRAVITYKLVKAPLQLVVALLLAVLGTRLQIHLAAVDETLRQQATAGWSVAIAHQLGGLSPHDLHLTVAAFAGDGSLTLIEGLLLWRGKWWAPWLVVVTMALLLPLELVAFVHKVTVGRMVLLLVNLAIVAYLVYFARRGHFFRPAGVP